MIPIFLLMPPVEEARCHEAMHDNLHCQTGCKVSMHLNVTASERWTPAWQETNMRPQV